MTDDGSILADTKKALGIEAAYTSFDVDITMLINMTFSTLQQLGVGPDTGFSIVDDVTTWEEYIGGDKALNLVKTYLYLKVRVLFDPPTIPSVLTAFQNQIRELEWRLNIQVDKAPVAPTVVLPTQEPLPIIVATP